MRRLFLLLAALAVLPAAYALNGDDLLEPEQAFRLSTRVIDPQTVEASWKIADGYYMYRDKFRFEVAGGDVGLKDAKLPPGTKKYDPTFDKVLETYQGQVRALLPLERRGAAAQTLTLKITSQGCEERIGVCLVPTTQTVNLSLPAVSGGNAEEKGRAIGSLKQLGDMLAPQASQEFLEPDKAFGLEITPVAADAVRARFKIADGYYLYRDKIRFRSADPALRVGAYELPKGKVKDDPYFGKQQVYYQDIEVAIPLVSTGNAREATLIAEYQGCAEKGICYAPVTKKVSLTLAPGAGPMAASPTANSQAATPAPAQTGGKLDLGKFFAAALAAFGVGLLLTFTPCVLPMIPILSSIIVGQGDQSLTKLRGGMLSLAYVLGTAVTYTAAGVLAGATGGQLQAYFQNPWAIGVFSALFVLLALSMFGFYDLQMPSFIQSRLQARSQKVRGGNLAGVFFIGMLSALIVGACVSPLLISALGVAISSRDPVLGGVIMFSMALGMGVILIAIGVGAGFLLPKAGAWMNKVKQVFGVLLLAVAIYILGALPQVPVLLLWAALFIIVAVYLGATQSLAKDASGWAYLWKGAGTLMLIWGVLALLGGFAGNRDIFNPLALGGGGFSLMGAAAPQQPAQKSLFQRVSTMAELDRALASAKAEGRPVMLDFYADWCTDCHRLERSTFADARVRDQFQRFALIKLDVTENNEETRALKQRFSVLGPPAVVFLGVDGKEKRELRFYGYKSPDQFLGVLKQV